MKHPFLLVWLTLIVLCGCTSSGKQKKHVIGLSQCMLDDAWRQAMINDMRIEASNYDDVEIIIKDAQNNNETQIQQIRDLIRQKVDVLIISPYQSEPITAVAEEAYRAGIPTIITDRKVNTDQYTSFVGANNYEIGLAAGNYAANYLPPNAIILEIWGLTQTSPAQERHKGFVDALREREDLSFRKIEGQWLVDTARMELRKLEHPEQIDFVYAHNDMMAIAAREYFMAWDSIRGRELRIIGVDAVAGAGLEAVEDGRINASFLYPTGGEQVIRTAMRIIQGEPVDKFIPLRTAPVDHQSARTLLLQADQLQKYRQRIEAQRSRIDGLSDRFYFLRNSLGVISLLMIGFIALSIYAFYINRKMRQANRKLISLNAEMKEVTAQKLQFFTNVSHEVRTPLTLILAPLDRLIISLRESPYASDLGLIQKNANRLLRVINQILDFRKGDSTRTVTSFRSLGGYSWYYSGFSVDYEDPVFQSFGGSPITSQMDGRYCMGVFRGEDLVNTNAIKVSVFPVEYSYESDTLSLDVHYDVRLLSISEDYYRYMKIMRGYSITIGDANFGALIEPADTYSNVENGFGIVTGYQEDKSRITMPRDTVPPYWNPWDG